MTLRQNVSGTSTRAITQRSSTILFALLSSFMVMTCALFFTKAAHAQSGSLEPNTSFLPQDVVKIVVDSLQKNDESKNDDGIATVFQFASPSNRSYTGPLPRFTQMIKRGFSDMLNHAGARFDPMEVNENTAVQAVWLITSNGTEVGYAFQLRKQPSGEFAGMWMTEGVLPLGKSGTRI